MQQKSYKEANFKEHLKELAKKRKKKGQEWGGRDTNGEQR